MAISILMNENKQLIVSSSSPIYQNDIGDYLNFIVPIILPDGVVDRTCEVKLKALNVGNQLFEYTLNPEKDLYKGKYYKYVQRVNSGLSAIAGKITLILTIKKVVNDITEFEIHSNEVSINVEKVNPVYGLASIKEVTSGNVSDIAINGDKLVLINSDGEQVGSGVSYTGDATTKTEIVTALPTTDIDTGTIYLVVSSTASGLDIYDEYMYIDDKWERLGTRTASEEQSLENAASISDIDSIF